VDIQYGLNHESSTAPELLAILLKSEIFMNVMKEMMGKGYGIAWGVPPEEIQRRARRYLCTKYHLYIFADRKMVMSV
jgi:hypothetical protein